MTENDVKEAGAACVLARADREGLAFEKVPGGYSLLLDRFQYCHCVWVLITLTPDAREDAARLLLDAGTEHAPLFFRWKDRDVYAFDSTDGFCEPECGRNGNVEVRGWEEITLPDKTFEEGLLRAQAGSSVYEALDTRNHLGLEQFLARWTGGEGWIEQDP
ncbi:MAG: hypothetical protein LBQ79_07215 [Deltaproteobacteria bacterium]|jgi:hypothetical protein|nr:hypothetical protein [Deltaproteobacteria bacterium]